MGFYCPHLRDLIVIPTLKSINLWSKFAEDLLLGTCAKESGMGKYLKQLTGPALGIFQIEPKTHDDVLVNIITNYPKIYDTCCEFLEIDNTKDLPSHDRLIYDLRYSTILARLKYLTIKEPFPENYTVNDLARYWKKYYNTELGKGTIQQFIDSYQKFVIYG